MNFDCVFFLLFGGLRKIRCDFLVVVVMDVFFFYEVIVVVYY